MLQELWQKLPFVGRGEEDVKADRSAKSEAFEHTKEINKAGSWDSMQQKGATTFMSANNGNDL